MTFFMKRYLFTSVNLIFVLRLCNNNELLTKVQNMKSIKAQIILMNNDDRLHHGIFITHWKVTSQLHMIFHYIWKKIIIWLNFNWKNYINQSKYVSIFCIRSCFNFKLFLFKSFPTIFNNLSLNWRKTKLKHWTRNKSSNLT